MALALIKVKIMPDSPQADLSKIEKEVLEILEKEGRKNSRFEREPIAFGLTAVIVLFGWEEEKSTDPLMETFQTLPNVNSAEIIDFRRAIG